MNPNLPQLIDAFAGLHVAVLGEAMLDSYLEGSTGRFCPEAPLVEQLGGVVQILPYLEDHSTTGIIERIGEN
jgi:bifunctional ADP-heptose synthase (sugar kinase/adenylyltransferase)